jgi:protein TonB
MASVLLKKRSKSQLEDQVGSSFAGSLLLHAAIFGSILGWTLLPSHKADIWGEHAMQAGAVQATMVDAIPLPPKQRTFDKGVLTSEAPSPAPTPATAKAEPPPKPDDVLIPNKSQTKPKLADKPAPEPPKHPQPAPPTTKATTGETAGVRIPQATLQTKNGTATVTIQEKSFGDRYAYYVNAMARKITDNWYKQEADPATSLGRKASITFTVNRDGSISDVTVAQRSGSPTLDTSAMRALQRIDGFGPLPGGTDHITAEYTFVDSPQ